MTDIEGVDYSDDHPSPTGLANVGKHFAARYIGAGGDRKHLTRAEADALAAAGLSIVSLVEGAANAALDGLPAGQAHARLAVAVMGPLGMPADRPCYYAVDFPVTAEQWPAVREYLRGAASVVGDRRVGVYGSYQCMVWAARDRVAAWFFQTYAWSNARWYAENHFEQYRNNVSLVGGTVDLCRAKVPDYGQWTPEGANTVDIGTTDAGYLIWRVEAIIDDLAEVRGGPAQGQPNRLHERLNRIDAEVTDVVARVNQLAGAVHDQLASLGIVDAVSQLAAAVAQLRDAPLIDAVQVAAAIAASPDVVNALAAAVAAQLSSLTGEITLSGGLNGRVSGPAPAPQG